ncbi:zinc finger protein RFP-like [Boleophthalmus pectinirostris]|uniref:zinc finger protein RFP-like n=1 Tax=Boleophthalmus pectinirostris TaxID=150288 RepID=UPI000A1C19AC|nr:zinc finger protein RFP-like [Boleophthalmus pectinirostris]
MSLSRVVLSPVQFRCPLCRGVFSEPVSIPCGHSFCFSCITSHWDQSTRVSCPKCHTVFPTRPQLCENAFAKDMCTQIKAKSLPPQAERVYCDVCVGDRTQAVRSCLVCLASYCQTHLEPHSRVPTLRTHTLVAPVGALESRLCKRHQRVLELFCRSEGSCVCVLCAEAGHQGHVMVPVERQSQLVKAQMEHREEQLQQMIQERLQRVDNISHNISLSREQTRLDLQQSKQIFSSLMVHLKKVQEEVVEQIQRTQEQAEHRAQSLVSQLQQEVKELRRSRHELEQLRQSQDHLHLVQSFSSLTLPTPTLSRSVPVHADPCLGTLRSAVARLELEVQKTLKLLCDQELERMQKYTVDVTFDPHTANPWLVLSEDRRRVWDGNQEQVLEQRAERFDTAPCVLGDKGFTSGRHYWEVEVGGKTAWDVGVARGSVSRRGVVTLSPSDGYWTVCLRRGGEYRACAEEAVLLPVCPPLPQVLALFVDHEEGRVSFYDVEAGLHLYSYTGFTFTEALFPFFNPETISSGGDNSAPLVIRATRDTAEIDNVMI